MGVDPSESALKNCSDKNIKVLLGYLDDVAVLSICIGWIESDLHSYIDWKLDQGSKQA